MRDTRQNRFHHLRNARKPRINYRKTDFADYLLMLLVCEATIALTFGVASPLAAIGATLCAFMAVSFALRHGVAWRLPLPLQPRRCGELVMALVYKVQNLPPVFGVALAVLVAENAFIAATPQWPHHTGFMRELGFALLYLHLGVIFIYRTVSLLDHWRKRDLVSTVLAQSVWKNVGLVEKNVRFELLHAYCTGLLTNLMLVVPWFLVLKYLQFSVLLTPLVFVLDMALQIYFLKSINAWFYRDHWLGHNSEADFIYLHGSHHDAIPVGMIAGTGTGFLEAVLRNVLAYPTPFANPLFAALAYTREVWDDINFHQYIPGIFPALSLDFRRVAQHSTHHFGRMEPYGYAIKVDQDGVTPAVRADFKYLPEEFRNSANLDEELTGFVWDNARHDWFLKMCEEHG